MKGYPSSWIWRTKDVVREVAANEASPAKPVSDQDASTPMVAAGDISRLGQGQAIPDLGEQLAGLELRRDDKQNTTTTYTNSSSLLYWLHPSRTSHDSEVRQRQSMTRGGQHKALTLNDVASYTSERSAHAGFRPIKGPPL